MPPSPETIISPRSPTIPTTFPDELLEKYREPQLIGMGGVARVFKAYNNQTGEVVALKIPVHFNETAGKCFMKEIKAWEDLSHENIVRIHEVNILPVPYVEMEFIGTSLADLSKPLSSGDAARIVRDIARGLGYAHSRGIIHRDIKPQNILMSDTGIPRITDWGMSKVIGSGFLPTITGFSLSYAAPEQIAPELAVLALRPLKILLHLLQLPSQLLDLIGISCACSTLVPSPNAEAKTEMLITLVSFIPSPGKAAPNRFGDAKGLIQ